MDIPNSLRATQNALVDGIISCKLLKLSFVAARPILIASHISRPSLADGRAQSFASHLGFSSPDDGEFTDSDDDDNDLDDFEHDGDFRPRRRDTRSSPHDVFDDDDEEDSDSPVLLMPPPSSAAPPAPHPILAHPSTSASGPGPSERSPLLQLERQPSISFRDAPEVIASGRTVDHGYVPTSPANRSPELRALKGKGSIGALGKRTSIDSLSVLGEEGEAKEIKKDPVTGSSTFGQSVGYLVPFSST